MPNFTKVLGDVLGIGVMILFVVVLVYTVFNATSCLVNMG